jgi:uncharacterized membrane protein
VGWFDQTEINGIAGGNFAHTLAQVCTADRRKDRWHVYTLENLFHLLHQLTAIVWLGGVLALNVLQIRLAGTKEATTQASLLHVIDLYGRAVIAPAAIVNLISGIVLITQMDDVAWNEMWVIWGLAGIVFSVLLGGTLIRATNAGLRELAAAPALDEAAWSRRQRQAAALYMVNLLVLLSVVWAMVFKPTV